MEESDNKRKIIAVLLMVVAAGTAILIYIFKFILKNDIVVSPLGNVIQETNKARGEKPFDKYTVLNLANYKAKQSDIIQEKLIKEQDNFTSSVVSYKSQNKKITAMLNMPKGNGPFPVIVMFRGYVDPLNYQTGIGTERAAEVFAKNGYITFAPDFLGYAGSDKESENVFESRFQTYTTALDAIAAVPNIEKADSGRIGIWGHSNGGQIAITVLEATEKEYPTVLWAPVSKPFPFSILFFTDEADDRGKFLRKQLALFEEDYNADLYAITDYLDRIKAPIQLHQGTNDDSVPKRWSDEFNKNMEALDKKTEYFVYSGADHNLMPSWNTVVERSLNFYNKNLSK